MDYLAAMLLGALVMLLLHRPSREAATKAGNDIVGLCAATTERTSAKEARKQRILDLFEDNNELDNATIRESLGISAQAVVNYMDKLEEAGKVVQVGSTGRDVVYKRKK